MIINILGSSGSGKTTLGNKLKKLKNTIVIDTDDIDDPNCIKIINKYSFDKKTDSNRAEKEIAILNKIDLEKIIDKNKNNNIIIVGFLHLGMDFIKTYIDKGFMIKIDPEILWKQYNMRTSEIIHKNIKEINSLLNSNMHPVKKHIILSKKFGIRNGFDCKGIDDYKKDIKKNMAKSKELGYVYSSSNDIYDKIIKLLN